MSEVSGPHHGQATRDHGQATREHVDGLLRSLGLSARDVAELVIDPWGITVTSYARDEQQRHYRTEAGALATSHRHFPGALRLGEPR